MDNSSAFEDLRSRLQRLSRGSRLKIAFNWAQRVRPAFEIARQCDPADRLVFSNAMELVAAVISREAVAEYAGYDNAKALNKTKILPLYGANDPVRKALSTVAYAARLAKDVGKAHPADSDVQTIISIYECASICFGGDRIVRATILEELLAFENMTVDSVVGNLWPFGKPAGWPEQQLKYDVFLSHATEDKGVVRPVADALKSKGFRVWFDTFQLKAGDSIRGAIENGMAQSRCGLVFISQSFLNKEKKWIAFELDGLVALHMAGRRLIPIWHQIDGSEIAKVSPSLSMKLAIRHESVDSTVEAIRAVLEDVSAWQ